jgi:lipopolysaccharide export system permease protein
MSRVFWYLARELAKSYVLVSVALLVLFNLLAFLTESQDVGDERYDVLDALLVIIYSTPAMLVDLSPFIALLATLSAYDRLNASSELIALRSAGISSLHLGRIAALVAGMFMVVIAGVELAARPLRLEASLLRMMETAPTGNPLRGGGFWIRTGQTFVNVAALEDARRPSGIRLFSFADDTGLQSYLRASAAEIVDAADWQLEEVWRKNYTTDVSPALVESLPTLHWRPTWDRGIALYDLPIVSFTLAELTRRIARPTNKSVGAQAEQAELWRRITLPLAAIAYALLAAPFGMFKGIRGGRSGRLVLGTALAFLIYIAQQVVTNAGILAGLPIAVTAVVPPLLVLMFALTLLRRLD